MCFVMFERIGRTLARTAALFIHAVTASISRTHSQCQRRGLTPLTAGGPAEPVSSSLENRKVSKVALLAREGSIAGRAISCPRGKNGGAYRDRTDDLKLAKLALSQLS